MNKKSLAWIAGLIVLALVVFVLAGTLAKKQTLQPAKPIAPTAFVPDSKVQPTQFNLSSPPAGITTTLLAESDVFAVLPADFPKETGSRTLLSLKLDDVHSPPARILLTTTTAKSLADALSLYKAYLSGHGWNIRRVTDNELLKDLSADKGMAHLEISFSYDGGSKSNVAVVSYTPPPK